MNDRDNYGGETLSSPQAESERRRGSSARAVAAARFLPGSILAKRYRIVGPIGKGGMGEVYRAEDMRLGQTVALKFLPAALERDPSAVERLLGEVRIARQISHPNVCRVYDIGEEDGRPFLSMEHIDGENLASLLKRIGRLPQEKAIEIARQLCSGLQAAHKLGVLHRDLKPANVVLDPSGQVRILDFGLAGLAESFKEADLSSGTPAYMAPEQLAGRAVTIQSDLYSLGLVLYELFAGRRAFPAGTTAAAGPPDPPSGVVEGLDPAVERTLLSCLEAAPEDRPGSALAVAAALPGGDPLAAALAAGETPAPELVANSPAVGLLRPATGVAMLASILGASLLVAWLSPRTGLAKMVGKPPAVLVERSRELAIDVGYYDSPADSVYGFWPDQKALDRSRAAPPAAELSATSPDESPLRFWYRQSPEPLVSLNGPGIPLIENPPYDVPGMLRMVLRPDGRLLSFWAVPEAEGLSRCDPPGCLPRASDWSTFFEAAGLDPADFDPTEPRTRPPFFTDHVHAWASRAAAGSPELVVQAAEFAGRPAFFELATLGVLKVKTPLGGDLFAVYLGTLMPLMLAIAWVARSNARRGRGDRRGAFRSAAFVFFATGLWALSTVHHTATITEFVALVNLLGLASLMGISTWLPYMAIEPDLRRYYPDALVSWVRVLRGRFSDPLVGQHILVGCLLGLLTALGNWSDLSGLYGEPNQPHQPGLLALEGPAGILGALAFCLRSMWLPFLVLGILPVARTVLPGRWPAILCLVALLSLFFWGDGRPPAMAVLFGVLWAATMVRFGILAHLVASPVWVLVSLLPLTLDPSAWYFTITVIALGLIFVLAAYGFYVATGGRGWFVEEGRARAGFGD